MAVRIFFANGYCAFVKFCTKRAGPVSGTGLSFCSWLESRNDGGL